MTLLRSLQVVLIACLTLPSCKDNQDGAKGGKATATLEPTSEAEPDTPKSVDAQSRRTWHGDYVLRSGTLYRILEDGKMEATLTHAGARYCKTDSRSQSIWLVGSSGLSVYDFESQRKELVVAANPEVIGAFEVRFGLDQGKVGNAEELQADIALVVVATKHISLNAEIMCEGAREALCYVDTSSDDPDLWELRPAQAHTKKLYDALTLAETPLLLELAARRLGRPEIEEEADSQIDVRPGVTPDVFANDKKAGATGEPLLPIEHLACGRIQEYVATDPSASTQ